MISREGRQLIFLSGSPYEMGFQQGRLLQELIQEYYRDYWRAFRRDLRLFPDLFFKWSARLNRRHFPENELAELQGIADGAKVSLQKVLLLNYSDNFLMNIYSRMSACTQFAVWGEGTAQGGMIHAKNVDWIHCGVAHRFIVMAFYRPAGGYRFVTPQSVGSLYAMMAMNEKGICVSPNLSAARECSALGLPDHLLCRRIALQAASLAEALELIKSAPRVQTPGFQMMISDAKTQECLLVEMTGRHFTLVRPKRNYQLMTNHFQSLEMRQRQRKVLCSSSSTFRYERAEEMILAEYGRFTVDSAVTLLRDHVDLKNGRTQASAYTICCHDPAEKIFPGVTRSENTSLCSVVVDSSRLTLHAAFGKINAPHGEYLTYPLRDSWNRRRVPQVVPDTLDVGAGQAS